MHQALTVVERPATVRAWLDLPPVRTLLTGLSRDDCPLTHEILDEFPAGKTLAHLRSVLVAAGALPGRDERLVQLERCLPAGTAAAEPVSETSPVTPPRAFASVWRQPGATSKAQQVSGS